MPLRRFLPYDVLGAGLWGSTFFLLGYVFWQSFAQLVDYAKKGALALGTVIVLVVGIVWLVRWVRRPENRRDARDWLERQAERPALRPFATVLRPVLRTSAGPARFVWHRVTPGDLGLELTTLLAVGGVGAFMFVAHIVTHRAGDVPLGDRAAYDMAVRLQVDPLVTVAKVVSVLGALPVVTVLRARRDRVPALAARHRRLDRRSRSASC